MAKMGSHRDSNQLTDEKNGKIQSGGHQTDSAGGEQPALEKGAAGGAHLQMEHQGALKVHSAHQQKEAGGYFQTGYG